MATVYSSMTVVEILAQVVRNSGLNSSNSDDKATMYAAITSAGLAACDYRNWWFLETFATFDTVADTESYELTGGSKVTPTNSTSFDGIKVPTAVWWDTDSTGSRRPLQAIGFKAYQSLSNRETSSGSVRTYTFFGSPVTSTMYLHPTPSDVKEVKVYYSIRHPKIVDSVEVTDFLIPGDYQWEIYVNGAIWLLQHETTDPAALKGSPAFQATLQQMAANAMDEGDDTSNEGRFYGGAGHGFVNIRREGLTL